MFDWRHAEEATDQEVSEPFKAAENYLMEKLDFLSELT
jgi:hypothetical protein